MEVAGIATSVQAQPRAVEGTASGAQFLSPYAPWEKILEQERRLACQPATKPEQETAFKLAFRMPREIGLRPMESAAEKVLLQEAKREPIPVRPLVVAEIRPAGESVPVQVRSMRQVETSATALAVMEVEKKTPILAKAAVDPNQLTLDSFAAKQDLLQKAWVNFDQSRQTWQAKWNKPPLFNFGMILKPALMDELKVGQSLVFTTNGQEAKLTRNTQELVLTSNGRSMPVSAPDIYRLLSSGISSNDLTLSVNAKGDLVLEAVGDKALAMARSKS